MTEERKTVPLEASFSTGFKDAKKPEPGISKTSAPKLQIGGEHTQAGTGKVVAYRVDLEHGDDSTTYAARVLLLGGKWHELVGGVVNGPQRIQRMQQLTQAVLGQIDGLDFEALNKG